MSNSKRAVVQSGRRTTDAEEEVDDEVRDLEGVNGDGGVDVRHGPNMVARLRAAAAGVLLDVGRATVAQKVIRNWRRWRLGVGRRRRAVLVGARWRNVMQGL